MKFNHLHHTLIITVLSLFLITGCEKYLENTQLPAGTIAGDDAFVSDNSVAAIVTGNYLSLNATGPFSGGGASNLGNLAGLFTDELKPVATSNTTNLVYYNDALTANNSAYWGDLYNKIYLVNSAIEGINSTPAFLYYKDQWLGECYFLRAFLYFNLVNMYGDVPLALTSDFTINNKLSRAPQSQVYDQIIADAGMAKKLLSTDYKDGFGTTTTYRVRPNQAVATALLARAYLYTGKWDSAEAQTTALINNTDYKLETLAQTFITASKETIWALATKNDEKTYEYSLYNNAMPAVITPPKTPSSYTVLVAMNSPLINAFETNDGRFTNWIRSTTVSASATTPAVTYYFPNKYRSATGGAEKTVILRLAEMYLIRAEARARQDNISGAQADLNAVRTRAGLPATTAGTRDELINAITAERRVELFTECGIRFFDLKRTGSIDGVMTTVAQGKGTTWSSYMSLWPINPNDIILNPNITPNPGY